jgi:hypothetical protein
MHNEIVKCYKNMFSTDAGQRILEDLERVCTFTPNTQDSNDVFLRLGKLELLKYIKAMMEKKI